ncbi:hypothetical protein V5P93_003434 [Actinokineospora auranticolor]|uniref:Uncharacterized protein n=1 Tax=Actinokineospora auranticolor TaxID=155976 RepID=A0A2S6GPC1_9PSEU|nr:hypothetical protein [Actinokineospora auranticolor]PPK67095.1 hypothetical protein CLV40_10892 [Actinokineospora auranticolor]
MAESTLDLPVPRTSKEDISGVDLVRTNVSGLLTPAPRLPRVAVSAESIGLTVVDGTVIGSRRLTDPPGRREAVEATVGLLRGVGAHAEATGARLQSVIADLVRDHGPDGTPRRSGTRLLARVETAGGPVLLGTATGGDTARLPLAGLADLPDRIDRIDRVGSLDRLRDRPLVLWPSVAVVLVAGLVFSLTSTRGKHNAARLAGRRVLPPLTVVAEGTTLVDAGVLTAPTWVGPVQWDHDAGREVPDPVLTLSARGADTERPDDAVDLVWCVEGLSRYHADGTVRLRCLAKADGRWSALTLAGKPIHLLRHLTGFTGPQETVYTDSVVTTKALVLNRARTMEEQGHGRITED